MNNTYNDKRSRYSIPLVTLETVDSAVTDYFNKKLNIHVDAEKGNRKKVEAIWALGERWKITRKNNFKDANGTLILPLMSIKRTDINRDPGFGGLGQETAYITIVTENHPKTSNIQNLVKQRKIFGYSELTQEPVRTILTIPYPDFCTVSYEISIWSQYETQMNEILEKIFYSYDYKRTSSFLMPVDYDGVSPKGGSNYFVGFKDGNVTPQSNTEDITDQERVIKYTYTIRTPVYLILDAKDETLSYGKDREGVESTGKKIVYEQQTQNQVRLKEEVLSLENFLKLYG